MIKAFIFDMDGVLIDTEKLFFIYWRQAARDCGYEMTEEQALSLRSLAGKFAAPLFKEWYGEAADYQACRRRRMELMNEHIAKYGIEKKAGVDELMTYLKQQNLKISLATATDFERATRYLKMLDLLHYFDKITCATMVENGKPYPDVYLAAVAELGFVPEECVAVEDSPNGVTSAFRAGCKVIMVPDLTQPDEQLQQKLYRKCDSLTAIPKAVFGVSE